MSALVLSIVSLVVGIIATTWVSRYYFRRSVDKSLTPYVQFISSIFEGVDPSVREALKIAYKGTPVDDLLEIQFLVANTGQRSIRDVISPLTLPIPRDCSLLDASILHISPMGRLVAINRTNAGVSFAFPLLNGGDFFITKLLLRGKAKLAEFQFSITVDDLPPLIDPVPLPPDLIERDTKRVFERGAFVGGLVMMIIGLCLTALVYGHRYGLLAAWRTGIVRALPEYWWLLISCVVGSLLALLLLVLGVMVMIWSFTDFEWPKRRKFRVPNRLHPRPFNLHEFMKEDPTS